MPDFREGLCFAARKELEPVGASKDDQRIVEAILSLDDDSRPSGCRRSLGRGDHRIRCGDYRAAYSVPDALLVVTALMSPAESRCAEEIELPVLADLVRSAGPRTMGLMCALKPLPLRKSEEGRGCRSECAGSVSYIAAVHTNHRWSVWKPRRRR